MSNNIEQLKAALRDVLLEQDELRQRLAAMRERLSALQALSGDLQADAPPDGTPWQQADGKLHSCQGVDGRYYYGLTQQQAVEVPMQMSGGHIAQNDCIRLYVARGADGRNHYGKTLEEAQRLAAEGKYQEPQWTPRDTPWPVPWQQADGWEGRQ